MELTEKQPLVDLYQRFRKEIRDQGLKGDIRLVGNDMQKEIARTLLENNRNISLSDSGTEVRLMSLEAYGSLFLSTFMELSDLHEGPFLLHTIPEDLLIAYAEKHGIGVVREEKDDIRKMLDKIAETQPQIYLALGRSAERLA